MVAAAWVKIECVQGDPVDQSWTFSGVNLAGATVEAPISNRNYEPMGAFTASIVGSSSRLQLTGVFTGALNPGRYLSQLRITPLGGGSVTYLNIDLIIHRRI